MERIPDFHFLTIRCEQLNSENELLTKIKERFHFDLPPNHFGIGDDCAVLFKSDGVSQLLTTDSLVEHVHFTQLTATAQEIGYKAVVVNISDIAAMGGLPKFILLSLSLPRQLPNEWFDSLLLGVAEAASEYDVLLIGGDLNASNNDIVIGVTAIGEAEDKKICYRSGAKPGDFIVVTDELGDSLAGLLSLENKQGFTSLEKRHLRPQARINEGLWLASSGHVTAMMDLSDGLSQDLPKLCQSSRAGAFVEVEKIPYSLELKKFAKYTEVSLFDLAIVGGEDYSLLLTVAPRELDKLKVGYQEKFGKSLYSIGRITSEREIRYTFVDRLYQVKRKGYSHF